MSTGRLPAAADVDAALAAARERFRTDDSGEVADYIPAPAAQDPALFGLAVADLGGGTTHLGTDRGKLALCDVSFLGLMRGTLNGFLRGVAVVETRGVEAREFLPRAHVWFDASKTSTADHAARIDVDDEEFPADDAVVKACRRPRG